MLISFSADRFTKNHDCNKFELGADATEAAKSLAKWEHFSKRYASHAQAITLQAKLKAKAADCISKLENEHHKVFDAKMVCFWL